jgi:hypothetical protein
MPVNVYTHIYWCAAARSAGSSASSSKTHTTVLLYAYNYTAPYMCAHMYTGVPQLEQQAAAHQAAKLMLLYTCYYRILLYY